MFVCCITPSTSDHRLVFLSAVTPGSLLITVDTVRKGEDRLRSGKKCLLIISLGVSCQCQPCGEERQSLQREAGRRRQWVWGSQPVIASHCYSLHSPYTPDQPSKLCVPGLFSLTKKTWGFAVLFRNPYACWHKLFQCRKRINYYFSVSFLFRKYSTFLKIKVIY